MQIIKTKCKKIGLPTGIPWFDAMSHVSHSRLITDSHTLAYVLTQSANKWPFQIYMTIIVFNFSIRCMTVFPPFIHPLIHSFVHLNRQKSNILFLANTIIVRKQLKYILIFFICVFISLYTSNIQMTIIYHYILMLIKWKLICLINLLFFLLLLFLIVVFFYFFSL